MSRASRRRAKRREKRAHRKLRRAEKKLLKNSGSKRAQTLISKATKLAKKATSIDDRGGGKDGKNFADLTKDRTDALGDLTNASTDEERTAAAKKVSDSKQAVVDSEYAKRTVSKGRKKRLKRRSERILKRGTGNFEKYEAAKAAGDTKKMKKYKKLVDRTANRVAVLDTKAGGGLRGDSIDTRKTTKKEFDIDKPTGLLGDVEDKGLLDLGTGDATEAADPIDQAPTFGEFDSNDPMYGRMSNGARRKRRRNTLLTSGRGTSYDFSGSGRQLTGSLMNRGSTL